ncbi:MAG: MATE family efflux transporter [Acidimicrobiales bacterium]|nr:MATE family efflux transporter [Acidimicrobiales bacterium]
MPSPGWIPALRTEFDRPIAALAFPALGSLVAEPLYVLADTAVVGRIGTNELAGLALASTVLLTVHSLMIFLAYGATGPIARMISAGDELGGANRGVQGLWLAGILGVGAAVLMGVLAEPLLVLLQADGAVLDAGLLYLRLSLPGFPFLLLAMAAAGVMHGRQDTRRPLAIAVTSALLNLVLEIFLVFGLGFGLGASALSTVVAQIISGSLFVALVVRWARATGASPAPQRAPMLSILKSGQALVVRTASLRGSLTLAAGVASSIGTAELAAHQIALQVWFTLALALDAVAIAGQALTGRYLGEGDTRVAWAASRRMIEIDLLVGVAFGVLVVVFRHPIAELFTTDSAVISFTAFILLFVAAQQPMNGVVFALDGILIGAGDLWFLAKWMVVAFATFSVGAGIVLVTGAGLGWLWTTILAFMLVRMVPLLRRWRSGAWLV